VVEDAHGLALLDEHAGDAPGLVPLTSLWLDTLVLRLMNNQGKPPSASDVVCPVR
jgi:hypothetical protein